jgi:hypothetical protein
VKKLVTFFVFFAFLSCVGLAAAQSDLPENKVHQPSLVPCKDCRQVARMETVCYCCLPGGHHATMEVSRCRAEGGYCCRPR